jgi:hypothetical protein
MLVMVRELYQELLRSAQVIDDEIKDTWNTKFLFFSMSSFRDSHYLVNLVELHLGDLLVNRPIHVGASDDETAQRRVFAKEYPLVEFAAEICQGRC